MTHGRQWNGFSHFCNTCPQHRKQAFAHLSFDHRTLARSLRFGWMVLFYVKHVIGRKLVGMRFGWEILVVIKGLLTQSVGTSYSRFHFHDSLCKQPVYFRQEAEMIDAETWSWLNAIFGISIAQITKLLAGFARHLRNKGNPAETKKEAVGLPSASHFPIHNRKQVKRTLRSHAVNRTPSDLPSIATWDLRVAEKKLLVVLRIESGLAVWTSQPIFQIVIGRSDSLARTH